MVIGMEPVLFQLEHVANRSRKDDSNDLGQNSVADIQATLLYILKEHTVMRISLLDTKGCQLTQGAAVSDASIVNVSRPIK